MARFIDAELLDDEYYELYHHGTLAVVKSVLHIFKKILDNQPTADVVEVVRCSACKYARDLDKHCEINRSAYRHCGLGRGEETLNVWHKYNKYYRDYSLVSLDEFCSEGERSAER